MYPSAPEAISMKGRLRVGTRRGAADSTVVGEVGFWLLGERLGDDGKILGSGRPFVPAQVSSSGE